MNSKQVKTAPDGDSVDQLAVLLRQAAPLAKLVNSDQHSDEDRERLRVLVGRKKYVELAVNLGQMCSSANRKLRGAAKSEKGMAGLRNVSFPWTSC